MRLQAVLPARPVHPRFAESPAKWLQAVRLRGWPHLRHGQRQLDTRANENQGKQPYRASITPAIRQPCNARQQQDAERATQAGKHNQRDIKYRLSPGFPAIKAPQERGATGTVPKTEERRVRKEE